MSDTFRVPRLHQQQLPEQVPGQQQQFPRRPQDWRGQTLLQGQGRPEKVNPKVSHVAKPDPDWEAFKAQSIATANLEIQEFKAGKFSKHLEI